jgi:hypothetical protein
MDDKQPIHRRHDSRDQLQIDHGMRYHSAPTISRQDALAGLNVHDFVYRSTLSQHVLGTIVYDPDSQSLVQVVRIFHDGSYLIAPLLGNIRQARWHQVLTTNPPTVRTVCVHDIRAFSDRVSGGYRMLNDK